MPVAHTIELPFRDSVSPEKPGGSRAAPRAALIVGVAAFVLALLGCAYVGARTVDGYPDVTQQWTD